MVQAHPKLRVLKIDAFYPVDYLLKKQKEQQQLVNELSYDAYYNWLISLRGYLSDYFSFHFNENGWESREFFVHDDLLIKKLEEARQIQNVRGIYFIKFFIKFLLNTSIKLLINIPAWKTGLFAQYKLAKKYWYIDNYITHYNPDILFIREPAQIDGKFWDKYMGKKFIISLIGCNTAHPINWNPHRNNLILTLTPAYTTFFKLQNIPVYQIEYGVDERVFETVKNEVKKFEISFVGLLGSIEQTNKTELMEAVAQKFNLTWWGPKGNNINNYPHLLACWQGETSGIDMFKIYKQSSIVLNDYVDMAEGLNVNMRTKEVLQVGTFLLTRDAINIKHLASEKALVTFNNAQDCLEKIEYFLDNAIERETLAEAGRLYAKKHFNYSGIVKNMMNKIFEVYSK